MKKLERLIIQEPLKYKLGIVDRVEGGTIKVRTKAGVSNSVISCKNISGEVLSARDRVFYAKIESKWYVVGKLESAGFTLKNVYV